MKRIFRFLIATMMVFAFASCDQINTPTGDGNGDGTQEPGDNTEEPVAGELNQNIKFTLKLLSVDATEAMILITSDGTIKDTWYSFYSTNTDVTAAISEKYTELTANGGKINGLKKLNEFTATLSGLQPDTDYVYVVMGLTADGELYGKPISLKFKTSRDVRMTVNENWSVAYSGPTTLYGQDYDHSVTVTSTDKNKYFISVWDKPQYDAIYEQLGDETIKALAEYELKDLKNYVDMINEYYANDPTIPELKLSDMLFTGNGTDAAEMTPGEWLAFAWGVSDDGELSGYYAVSDVIEIQEEEATAEYSAWLGDWTWTGDNGVAWDVTFVKGFNNISYYMIGWEGLPADNGFVIPVSWYPEEEVWQINCSWIGSFQFGDQSNPMDGEVYISGAYMYDGSQRVIYEEGFPVCLGGYTEDGKMACIGYSDGEEEGVTITHMHYFVDFGDRLSFIVTPEEGWPTFPITITPNSNSSGDAQKAVRSAFKKDRKGVQKYTQIPRRAMKCSDVPCYALTK